MQHILEGGWHLFKYWTRQRNLFFYYTGIFSTSINILQSLTEVTFGTFTCSTLISTSSSWSKSSLHWWWYGKYTTRVLDEILCEFCEVLSFSLNAPDYNKSECYQYMRNEHFHIMTIWLNDFRFQFLNLYALCYRYKHYRSQDIKMWLHTCSLFLPHFDVICDQLLNRCTTT